MTSPDPTSSPTAGSPASRVDLHEFEALFHKHYGALCEFVRGYVKSREVAEELVQDLFVRLWELRSGAAAQPLVLSYLYTAARNRAIGHLRKERVARRWAEHVQAVERDEPPGETAGDELHCQELATAIEHAVAALPERCRLIFTMSRYQGLSYAEIAEALGISPSTVETQISRAIKNLRTKLIPFLGLVFLVSGSGSLAELILR